MAAQRLGSGRVTEMQCDAVSTELIDLLKVKVQLQASTNGMANYRQ